MNAVSMSRGLSPSTLLWTTQQYKSATALSLAGAITARLHRTMEGNLHMANHLAQAVARQFQLTFGCTRLQEREYFCSRLQSTL
jgi:hypothetical protein